MGKIFLYYMNSFGRKIYFLSQILIVILASVALFRLQEKNLLLYLVVPLIFFLFINLFFLFRRYRDLEKTNLENISIITNLNIGIIEYDRNLKIKFINPRALEILNLEEQSVVGRIISTDLFNKEVKLRNIVQVFFPILSPSYRFIPQKTRYPQIVELTIKEPKETTLKIVTIPLSAGEVNFGFLKIIFDISREKAISKNKSEFISITAHQLRTPLAAIKWAIKMLMDGDVGEINEKQRELLRKGYESNERLVRLVNDLLNVARIEEGRFGYQFKMIDYVNLARQIVSESEIEAKEKNVSLKFMESSELIPQVLIDSSKIALVLQNIIANAINYSNSGDEVKFFVALKGDYIQTAVSDKGLGIPEEQKPRIFSKFFRAVNVIHHQTVGTGLGLFIAKNVILRHGGNIWFDSEEGKGTTFYFTIPVEAQKIPTSELYLEEEV